MAKKVILVNTNPVYEVGMVSTVFGKNTEFDGELTFKKSLQINGKFAGDIYSENGFLVIGEGAEVKANIRVNSLIIKGSVSGNVEALEKVELQSKAQLHGNIRTARLNIADGVLFDGKCEMIKHDDKSSSRKSLKSKTAKAVIKKDE